MLSCIAIIPFVVRSIYIYIFFFFLFQLCFIYFPLAPVWMWRRLQWISIHPGTPAAISVNKTLHVRSMTPTGPAAELDVVGSDCARAAVFALLGCLHLSASPGFVTFQWSVLGQSCSHLKPEHNDQVEPEFIRAREECQVRASPVKREFHNIELTSGRQTVGRVMVVLMYISPSV